VALTAALGWSSLALAQDGQMVTLKSFDGFTQLRGELVEFDGSVYTLQTRLGLLEIEATQVTCEGEGCPEDTLFGAAFGILGAETIAAQLMPRLIQGYADTLEAELEQEIGPDENQRTYRLANLDGREMAAISVRPDLSGDVIPAIADGSAEIGMTSRRMRDSEAALLTGAGKTDLRGTSGEKILALDGIAVIVNRNNPLRSLALSEIAQIFAGEITNWSALGGPDLPIAVYAQSEATGTRANFDSLLMEPNGLVVSGSADAIDSSTGISDRVSTDPAAIGFTDLASVRAARALPIRQECGMLSYPTSFAIKAEEYPLATRLYLYDGSQQDTGHARRLAQFAASEAAAPLIEEAGFISTRPESQDLNDQGMRITYAMTREDEFSLPLMREMLTEFRDAERMSTTFRFTPGSSQLTAKSQADAEEFAQQIVDGRFAGKEILLVGFTDSIGQFELNRALAQRRAQGVLFTMAAAVSAAEGGADFGGTNIRVQGYGELTPVGCNTTFAGRVANRRVEVWVR
jgi:phosphate transport system substrate-binding protein